MTWRTRLTATARVIEAISDITGRAISWLTLLLVLLVSYDVGMRYIFRAGSVGLQELEWHLFALIFLLGAAYTLRHDGHVRVDFLYQRASLRTRAWIDLLGTLLFLLPFCAFIIYSSWPFVARAFLFGESSVDAGGLPYRFLIKAAIPVGMALLAMQGVAIVLRNLQTLLGSDNETPGAP